MKQKINLHKQAHEFFVLFVRNLLDFFNRVCIKPVEKKVLHICDKILFFLKYFSQKFYVLFDEKSCSFVKEHLEFVFLLVQITAYYKSVISDIVEIENCLRSFGFRKSFYDYFKIYLKKDFFDTKFSSTTTTFSFTTFLLKST